MKSNNLLLSLMSVLPVALAVTSTDGDGNITISFFKYTDGDACKSKDISKTITITTETVPIAYTCFNVTDIFSQKNSTGFQRVKSQSFQNSTRDPDHPNGVAWLLYNQDLFDPKESYTHTWFKMADASGANKGKMARWQFTQYTLPDCQQLLPPEGDGENTPWYMSDCQTGEDGLCETSQYPVGSFSISNAENPGDEENSESDDKCITWEQHGASAMLMPAKYGVSSLMATAGVVATLLIIL